MLAFSSLHQSLLALHSRRPICPSYELGQLLHHALACSLTSNSLRHRVLRHIIPTSPRDGPRMRQRPPRRLAVMPFLFAELLTFRLISVEAHLPVQVTANLATLHSCGNRRLLYGARGRRQKIPACRLNGEPQSREPFLKYTVSLLLEAAP